MFVRQPLACTGLPACGGLGRHLDWSLIPSLHPLTLGNLILQSTILLRDPGWTRLGLDWIDQPASDSHGHGRPCPRDSRNLAHVKEVTASKLLPLHLGRPSPALSTACSESNVRVCARWCSIATTCRRDAHPRKGQACTSSRGNVSSLRLLLPRRAAQHLPQRRLPHRHQEALTVSSVIQMALANVNLRVLPDGLGPAELIEALLTASQPAGTLLMWCIHHAPLSSCAQRRPEMPSAL